jgi:DNA-binding transcriptional ArsR family regulator
MSRGSQASRFFSAVDAALPASSPWPQHSQPIAGPSSGQSAREVRQSSKGGLATDPVPACSRTRPSSCCTLGEERKHASLSERWVRRVRRQSHRPASPDPRAPGTDQSDPTITQQSGSCLRLVAAVGGTQPNISEHLLILNRAGIIAREKHGRIVQYRLVDPHVIPLLEKARESVSRQVAELADLIDSDPALL